MPKQTRADIFSAFMRSEGKRLDERDANRKQAEAWIRAVSIWGAMAAASEMSGWMSRDGIVIPGNKREPWWFGRTARERCTSE